MSKISTRVADAGTGRFVPNEEAKRRPKTTVTEKIKVGPTKKRK
jgi:predicted transcriptional regulator